MGRNEFEGHAVRRLAYAECVSPIDALRRHRPLRPSFLCGTPHSKLKASNKLSSSHLWPSAIKSRSRRSLISAQHVTAAVSYHSFVDCNLDRATKTRVASGTAGVVAQRCPEKTTANEDSIAVLSMSSTCGLIAIADGVGGHEGGDRASSILVEELLSIRNIAQVRNDDLRIEIVDAIERGDRRIQQLQIGAATTVAVVEIKGNCIRPYHVGDSTVLVVSENRHVKYRTPAHSPVGYAFESGMISEQEALDHDELHIVDNLVGCERMRIEIGPTIELAQRDTVVIGSDGLFDNLREDEIIAHLKNRSLTQRVEGIATHAMGRMQVHEDGEPCKPDDLSIVLFKLRRIRQQTMTERKRTEQETRQPKSVDVESEDQKPDVAVAPSATE